MSADGSATYQAREFAERAGVTVRALHHYDRLGLLKARRTAAGYRVYTDADLGRLEHIVALKFLGLSLAHIAELLSGVTVHLPRALAIQQKVLMEKRAHIEKALAVIAEMQSAITAGRTPEATQWKQVIEVFQMDQNSDWTDKYYTGEAKAKLDARRPLWSPELQERVSRQWSELMSEVETAKADRPTSEHAQDLAARWMGLVEEFTGGEIAVAGGLRKLYADKPNWPEGALEQMQPFRMSAEAGAFIRSAIAHRNCDRR
jgi:DNA-binding transcriptional MerR regulator